MVSIRFDSEFEERSIVFPDGARCVYHGNVWPNVEAMKSKIAHKHQNVILISGRTGTGKSEFAIQLAKALDPNFGIDNIFWDTDSLIKVAASNEDVKPPGTAFIFDEAREGTQSLNAMTETNRRMGLFLDTIRSRGYHIFLLQPSYFLFQKSIAIYAADILFHIEKRGNPAFFDALKKGMIGEDNPHEPFERGIGRIYDINQKKIVYIKGKKMEDMDAASCTWFTFNRSHGIVDWKEYERRKQIAVSAMNDAFDKSINPPPSKKEVRIVEFKQRAFYFMHVVRGIPMKAIQTYLKEDYSCISDYINNERRRLEALNSEVSDELDKIEEESEEDDSEEEEDLE
jgi:hypothetical protein